MRSFQRFVRQRQEARRRGSEIGGDIVEQAPCQERHTREHRPEIVVELGSQGAANCLACFRELSFESLNFTPRRLERLERLGEIARARLRAACGAGDSK